MSTTLARLSEGGLLVAPKKKSIALEMIEFQDASFGEDLEKIIGDIYKQLQPYASGQEGATKYKDIGNSPEVEKLQKLTFNRLGLKVRIITNEDLAAVVPFYSNKNHIFLNEFFRGNINIPSQDKILKRANGRKGTVDTHKAKVGGLFSETENIVFMNFAALFGPFKMTVPEVVAVYLHELGHAFHACEYSDRLETTNQVLTEVGKVIFSSKEKKDVNYVFREIEKINPKITAEEVDKLVNGDRVIAGVTWFKVITTSVGDQLQNSKYSQTSFEQMADNFASRFGYARELVGGLDKLHRLMGSPEKSAALAGFVAVMEAVYVSAGLAAMALNVLTIPGTVLLGIFMAVYIRFHGEDLVDYTYDNLKTRYLRIKHQMLEVLKDLKVPKEQAASILEEIRIVERAIEETNKMWSVFNVMMNFLVPSAKRAKESIVEQQLIEELAFNDLFVKSAELRVHA